MPCNDGIIDFQNDREYLTLDIKKRLDITTRLACMYCTTVVQVPDFAKVWWKKHQIEDKKRIKQELFDKEQKKLKAKQTKEMDALKKKILNK